MATKPFLKWAGGKTRVAPNILPHLKGATRLVEPFAGSCALYLQSDIQDALLCDVNPISSAFIKRSKNTKALSSIGWKPPISKTKTVSPILWP